MSGENEPCCVMIREENVDGACLRIVVRLIGMERQLNLLIITIIASGLYVSQSTIESIILRMSLWICEFNINVQVDNKNRIKRTFAEIETVIPQINKNRKRMINIRFVLGQVFKLMWLPYKDIPVT